MFYLIFCWYLFIRKEAVADWLPRLGKRELIFLLLNTHHYLSLVVRKPVFGVSDQVRHKPGCAATEDGLRLKISDLGRRGTVLSV